MNRAAARFAGLTALWLAVELLERVAHRAGVDEGYHSGVDAMTRAMVDDPRDGDDDLAAVDVSDVVAAHAGCCGGPAWT